jgi:hypothetical protein
MAFRRDSSLSRLRFGSTNDHGLIDTDRYSNWRCDFRFNASTLRLFQLDGELIDGTSAIILRSFAARAEALWSLFMSAGSVRAYFKFRSEFPVFISTLRCDHCRREIRVRVHRYWRMCFCSSACMTAYQQRLAEETKMKIRRLDADASYG